MSDRFVQFPASMGLNPRPVCEYDILCRRYYAATRAKSHAQVEYLERALLAQLDGQLEPSFYDDALAHGETMAACRFI